MPATSRKGSALDALRTLEAAAMVAERQVDQRRGELRRGARLLKAAQGDLRAYYAALELGDRQPDEAEENRLQDEIARLERRVERRRVPGRDEPDVIDVQAEAAMHAAVDRAQEARGAVATFIVEHREALQAEMVAESLERRDALLAAVEALSTEDARWKAQARRWRALVEHWGLSPAEIPLGPLPGIALQDIELVAMQVAGGARDPRGAIPAPASLVPGAEDEERHEAPLRGWEHVPRVISAEGGLLGA